MSKAKLLLILYQILFIPLIYLSLIRKNYFSITIEEFPIDKVNFGFVVVLALFVFYIALIFLFKTVKNLNLKTTLLFMSPLLIALVMTPPFMSRDTLAYFIPARNFIDIGTSPYEIPKVENPNIDWQSHYPHESWYSEHRYVGVYGPFFQHFTIPAAFLGNTNLYATVTIYKLLQTLVFVALIWVISRLKSVNPQAATWVLLNPVILLHFVLEGHNTVLIIFLLLLGYYFLEKEKRLRGPADIFAAFSVLIKYFSAIFIPIFWFIDKKFSWKRFFTSGLMFAAVFLLLGSVFPGYFARFARTGELYVYRQFCLYNCSPLVWLSDTLFGPTGRTINFFVSIFLWVLTGFVYLFLKYNPFKYLFWASVVFCLVFVSWLTPWYLLHPTIYGLMVKWDKRYLYLSLAAGFYAFLHSFGI